MHVTIFFSEESERKPLRLYVHNNERQKLEREREEEVICM
jgi:hypothetical protein